MNLSSTRCLLRARLWPVVSLAVLTVPGQVVANGSDLPPEVVIQAFLNVEDGRADMLVRVPLALLTNISLPKRGPGYLDLTNVGAGLRQAAAATGRQIEVSADGATLAPTTRELQLSFSSDRSFASYSTALAHLRGPPLPANTDLFWTQGYFDAHFEYSLPPGRPDLRIRGNFGAELGPRVKLRLEYLVGAAAVRSYEIRGDSGWIPLDPRWYQAAWLFAKNGFVDSFAADRFLFLLCLVAPFRRFRGLIALVVVLAGLHALTLTAAAEGALADVEVGWLPLFANTVLAAAMVLFAIANLAAPNLRRRWFLACVAAALTGFGLGRLLTGLGQFSGTHPLLAVVFYDAGIVLGAVVNLAIAFLGMRLVFAKVLGPLLGVIVLSALVGHVAWHGMIDNGSELARLLGRVPAAALWPAFAVVAQWLAPALLIGVAASFLTGRFDCAPVRTLLDALRERDVAETPHRSLEPAAGALPTRSIENEAM